MIDLKSFLAGKAPPSLATCVWTTYEDVQTHPTHLRFELHPPREVIDAESEPVQPDDDLATQLAKRNEPILKHAVARATQIFATLFQPGDDVLVVIKDCDPAASEGYVHSLIPAEARREAWQEQIRHYTDKSGPGVQWCLRADCAAIRATDILAGIAHNELGRKPAIGQRVVFVNLSREVVFSMYDDRGCLVFADAPEKLAVLCERFPNWIIGGFFYQREGQS